jgi:hypothetical protein
MGGSAFGLGRLTGVPLAWAIVIGLYTAGMILVVLAWWFNRQHRMALPEDPEILSWPEPSPEIREYNSLKNEFDSLKWAQQHAFDLLYKLTTASPDTLCHLLKQQGFGMDVAQIIAPLVKTRLVETSGDGILSPHPARRPSIKKLLEEWRSHGI